MRSLRALVVDDSMFNRRRISEILESLDHVTVVAEAENGEAALRELKSQAIDFVTLDLEMPRMDGFSFLRFAMAQHPIPVIVVSSYSAKANVFRALELGALDFVAKPSARDTDRLTSIRAELRDKVEMIRQLRPTVFGESSGMEVTSKSETRLGTVASSHRPVNQFAQKIVLIGASTGGPSALVNVFGGLAPELSAAILVVQHMPARFTRTFAERLDRLGRIRVSEASDRSPLLAGGALVCPGGHCVEVVSQGAGYGVRLRPPTEQDRYIPSINRAFQSLAKVVGSAGVAVVLTGMGDDGAVAVDAVAKAGGQVWVQCPEEAVLDGMPRAVIQRGMEAKVVTLTELSTCLNLLESEKPR